MRGMRPPTGRSGGASGDRGNRPIAIDLFAGAGGMSLGFEEAGFDVVAALESDRAHAAAHAFNFPRCEMVRRDAAAVTGDDLRVAAARGLQALGRPRERSTTIDVVFGGPPCQGFSVGGHLDPNDPRNELVVHFARLVAELRPAAFVLENVPAMASRALAGHAETVPEWVRDEMARYGYDTSPARVFNASSFGLPQDRRRLILVGVRRPFVLPPAPPPTTLALPKTPGATPRPWELGHRAAPADVPVGPSVRDAIGNLPDLDSFPALLDSDVARLAEAQRLLMTGLASDYAARLAGSMRDPQDYSRPRRRRPSVMTSALRTTHSSEVRERFAATPPGEREPVSRL